MGGDSFVWDSLSDTPVRGSVKTLAVAKSGGLWVGSADPASVGRIRDGKLQRYDAGLEGLEAVTAVVEDGQGTSGRSSTGICTAGTRTDGTG